MSVRVSPSISIRTPVSEGSVSSRPAATAVWITAVANASLPTVPAAGGISGRAGYSSSGMVSRLNVALPQVSTARPPSELIWDGRPGRQRPCRPGHRIGEDISFDEDVHGKPPFVLAPQAEQAGARRVRARRVRARHRWHATFAAPGKPNVRGGWRTWLRSRREPNGGALLGSWISVNI